MKVAKIFRKVYFDSSINAEMVKLQQIFQNFNKPRWKYLPLPHVVSFTFISYSKAFLVLKMR